MPCILHANAPRLGKNRLERRAACGIATSMSGTRKLQDKTLRGAVGCMMSGLQQSSSAV